MKDRRFIELFVGRELPKISFYFFCVLILSHQYFRKLEGRCSLQPRYPKLTNPKTSAVNGASEKSPPFFTGIVVLATAEEAYVQHKELTTMHFFVS